VLDLLSIIPANHTIERRLIFITPQLKIAVTRYLRKLNLDVLIPD